MTRLMFPAILLMGLAAGPAEGFQPRRTCPPTVTAYAGSDSRIQTLWLSAPKTGGGYEWVAHVTGLTRDLYYHLGMYHSELSPSACYVMAIDDHSYTICPYGDDPNGDRYQLRGVAPACAPVPMYAPVPCQPVCQPACQPKRGLFGRLCR